MKRMSFVWLAAGVVAAAGLGVAWAADMAGGPAASPSERIALARSGAPGAIGKGARVMDMDNQGKLVELAPGTNGFTCLPDDPSTPMADPMCADAPGFQWILDMVSKAPKPTNTAPGFAYMAKGGQHYEKGGKILMANEAGAAIVDEPPHWMLFWPYSAAATGLPSLPQGKGGTYVMWDGTPYAHLMVYQDPNKLK